MKDRAGAAGSVHMRREDTLWTSALAAATGATAKFSVSRGGRIGWQGTGKPHAEEQRCLPLLCSHPHSYVSITSFTYTFIQQISTQDCSVPGGMPGAGDAGMSVDRVRESISEENDE